MVQDQLVEYISSQMKLGVARATIKAALVGAGWQDADVEDTLKKVEGPAAAAASVAAVSPAKPASAFPNLSTKPSSSAFPSQLGKPSDPAQSIRVSDLVSASSATNSAASFMKSPAKDQPAVSKTSSASPSSPGKVVKTSPTTLDMTMTAGKVTGSGKKGGMVMKIIAIVLIVVFAGLAGFLYWTNMGLASQVATLNTTSAGVTASVASLTNQVAALNASDTTLAAENAALTASNTDLMANLSFAAVPPLSSSTPSIETVSLTGKLTSSKSSFTLTTDYGVAALVSNTKDASVVAALTPLVGTTGVTLTGMHTPGSQYMTVTAVNGTSVQ